MQLDPARYSHHLDPFDITEAERAWVMEQLWRYAVSAVDRAWGESPEQILLGIGGTNHSACAQDRLDSGHHLTTNFNGAAREDAAGKSDS